MAHWKDDLVLKIVNIVALLFTFGSNLSTVVAPKHYNFGGDKETYIHPAHFTFHVWGLIHILFIGYVIFQFTDRLYPAVTALGWRFTAVAVLNGIFVTLFAKSSYVAAFIFALIVATCVSHIYYALRSEIRAENKLTLALVHLPFSLWHAFSLVLVIVTLFAAVGLDRRHHSPGFWTQFFSIVALIFFTATAWAYSFGHSGFGHVRRGDIAGAAVIAWTLLGIFIEQKHPAATHWIALAGFVLSVFAIAKALYTTTRPQRTSEILDSERAPLISE